jgi:hypothetical protein
MKESKKMSAIPDLTPPTGKAPKSKALAGGSPDSPTTTAPKEAKAEKAPKTPKEPKPPVDPNAPKAPRAARQDYGYRPDAMITITTEKDTSKLRGQRKEWYDKVVAFNGKKVQEFADANKENPKDPPRGWVRFFAQEGFISLSGGTVPAPKVPEPKAADAPPTA